MKRRMITAALVLLFFCALTPLAAYNLHMVLSGQGELCGLDPVAVWASLAVPQVRRFTLLGVAASAMLVAWLLVSQNHIKYRNGMQEVVPGLSTPNAAGQGQYGTARWAKCGELGAVFSAEAMRYRRLARIPAGGLAVGLSKRGKRIYYDSRDTHTLTIGATRSGKTRTVVLPSLCLMALAGESMVSTDPKGELCSYTRPFLEGLGYEVIALDFRNPALSDQYNFLQPVIDRVNAGEVPAAVQSARDIAAMLVLPNERTEPIWLDGQRAALTMAILAVVVDNTDRPEFQNLSNARQFVAKMCTPGPGGALPIVRYLNSRQKDHPAQMALDVALIAPAKTRGSFYTSALVTLDLFTDPNIHTMTSATDFDHTATAARKRALFLILPDDRETYYPLAALFVYQHYQTLGDAARANGNRLPRRVNFICDEFGNFTKIPEFSTLFTVGAGAGIRFHLFLQDFSQLVEKYGPNVARTLRANAATWLFLNAKEQATREEISKLLGSYTTKSAGMSGGSGGQASASYNLVSRPLLTEAELLHIARPYQLVLPDGYPAVMYAPDLSKTLFNGLLGLGDEAHNQRLILDRTSRRKERPAKTAYWGIWDYYLRQAYAQAAKAEKNNDRNRDNEGDE